MKNAWILANQGYTLTFMLALWMDAFAVDFLGGGFRGFETQDLFL